MSELDRFLVPIDGDNPAGADLRLLGGDLTFSQLDEFRREADPVTDPGGETKHADWRKVVELCEASLIERTKDLELAAVLTQGWTRREGLAGLESGLGLLHGLIETFWDHLHPGLDEGEIILPIRARPLSWVGTSKDFLAAVRFVPLTEPIGEAARSWFDYEQAQRVDSASTRADQTDYQELLEAGYVGVEAWHGSLAATPPERLAATTARLQACRDALQRLGALCDEKFGDEGPYLTDLGILLEEMQDLLTRFQTSGETGLAAAAAEDPGALPGAAHATASVTASAAPAGPIGSRDEAYRRLREVAEYLRKTEPHSPVPPLIDRAVRWGNMTFESLFDDVVKNHDVREQTRDLLGLKEPPV